LSAVALISRLGRRGWFPRRSTRGCEHSAAAKRDREMGEAGYADYLRA